MNIQDFFLLGMQRSIPALMPIQHPVLNIGPGTESYPGATEIDYPEWDANAQPYEPLPWGQESFSSILCFHFLEHTANPVVVLQDLERILKPGGTISIVVPYYTSQMQAHDLDHKSAFCEETWRNLFSAPYYDKNKIDWKLNVHANFIMGIVERNLALFTQLRKETS